MSGKPFRALRFTGAGLGERTVGGGAGLVVTATGALATVDGDESIRQALLLLLCTTPGERLMRPEYGCHLNRLVFAPNDHTTAGLAIHYVRRAIARWEPRVEIVDLDAEADPLRPSQLNIQLRYRVRASLTVAALELPVSLVSAATDGGA
jgi:phage baseplate assembly protein W